MPLKLSPEQEEIVSSFGKGMAILAGAGSGKTTTLVAKCERLFLEKPEARMVAVSFTERSTRDLREKLSHLFCKLGRPEAFHHQWVMTIHGLCASLLREYPHAAGFEGEESVLSEPEAKRLWDKAIQILWLEPQSDSIQEILSSLVEKYSLESLKDLLDRLKTLLTFGASFDPNQKESQTLKELGQFVLKQYQRLKRSRGVIDFDDLEQGALRVLENPKIAESYQKRFHLILVDEFQDTNPIQARIIESFSLPDLSNLCVVGDPKQSIYRFRDADVQVFEDFCLKLPLRFTLSRNYRSEPGILHWLNPLCEKLFQASALHFEPLSPEKPISSQNAVARLNVDSPSDLGRWILGEMKKGIRLKEMALLVRRIRGNEQWFKALHVLGIPISVGGGGLFWEDPRIRELVAFLKWMAHPGHALSGGVFLRAPWMQISDHTLDEWIRNDLKSSFFQSSHPVSHLLRNLYQTKIPSPGELLLMLLEYPPVEEELSVPLLGLWHRVEEASARGLDFHGVVFELSQCLQEGRREKEPPTPDALDHLNVLTLHSAKGLEFSHVILIDFGDRPRTQDLPLLFWDRAQGAYLGNRDEKSKTEDQWRSLEKQKNLAESKRLFYVAVTRAKERLILVCPETGRLPEVSEILYQRDDWRSWVESGVTLPILPVPPLGSSPTFSRPPIPKRRGFPKPKIFRPRHSVSEWVLLSRCPRAYEWTFIRPRVSDSSPERDEKQKEDQELGILVHRALETQDLSLLVSHPELMKRPFLSPFLEWLKSAPLMQPEGPGRDVWSELAFEVPVAKEILVGSIDRVIVEKNRAILLDFKLTQHSVLSKAYLSSYQKQMNLYAFALKSLEPNLEAVEAWIIPICLDGNLPPQPRQIELSNLDTFHLLKQVEEAEKIVQGEPGRALFNSTCSYCPFKMQCDVFLETH